MSAQTNGYTPLNLTPPAASTALARVNNVEPSTMAELKDFAAMAARSRFYGAETPEQAIMIAMTGRDLGFSYAQSLQFFDVIKGKPALKAIGVVAACLAKPDICEYFRQVELTDTKAVYETKRRGDPPVRYEFTMEDAREAGLVTAMYEKHPKRMLSARCKAYLGRDVYPDIVGGLVETDEAREIAESRETHRVQPQTHVAEVVESRVVELTATEAQHAMEHGTSLDTPEERLAFWKSIADKAKAWPADERRRVQAHFKSLDDAYKAAQATREPGED